MAQEQRDEQEVPEIFRVPAFRWGIAFVSSAIIVAIAFLFLDGTVRTVALVVAVVDLVTTPKILEMAAEQNKRETA